MDFDEVTPSYALDEHPHNKGWSDTRCEYVGDRQVSSISHLDDATTSMSEMSDTVPQPEVKKERKEKDRDDNRIMKMEAFSVTSERRVV